MCSTASSPPSTTREAIQRLRLAVRGAVQGVGFRPYVYRLARELGLLGWVNNSPRGVGIEIEGPRVALESFLLRLEREKPPRSSIQGLESTWLDPVGYEKFEIRRSEEGGAKTALVLPDIAICADCLREILDPANRRYRYPFTNCTNCGPRYSLIEGLPYDRSNTTMRAFAMCDACRAEYGDPRDRRFHAQPNACPVCGPHLEWWDGKGQVLAAREEAIGAAAGALREGAIVAVKGLGGFHLLVDARSDEAIGRLRERKHREEKPFAVMVPDLQAARAVCEVSPVEERILLSPESPIVLLRRRDIEARSGVSRGGRSAAFRGDDAPVGLGRSCTSVGSSRTVGSDRSERITGEGALPIATLVAPGHPALGLMLPYTPLHALLLRDLGFPVVATSGNLSDEPICTDEREAVERLGGIADFFLVHNRPIARHVDDSVVRVVMGRELVLRRARGYAPLPIGMIEESDPVLAVGGHLKNTVALAVGGRVFGSQHIGDLENPAAMEAFGRVIDDLGRLYGARPVRVACDPHPDYLSTRHAHEIGLPVVVVQHHMAHVLSCMAENEVEGPVLGISWDGTGYGLDGRLWGGEFFHTGKASYRRIAHLRPFRLPGGERAIREPRRSAIGLLFEVLGNRWVERRDLASVREFSDREAGLLGTMLERGLNAPLTTSVGRLFDAAASLLGLRHRAGYEGQAAMELEFARDGWDISETYPFRILTPEKGSPDIVDWEPMVRDLLEDVKQGTPVGRVAARFHNTLAEIILGVARRTEEEKVILTGGCFQNACLTERTVTRLREEGFRPYWHQRVPPNDGGLALGQVRAASGKGFTADRCA